MTNNGAKIQNGIKPVTNEILKKDYILDQSIEELISVKPPFSIKIKALKQVGYLFSNSKTNDGYKILKSNMEKDLVEINKISELLFTSTEYLNVYINGLEIKKITGSKNPVKVVVKPFPSLNRNSKNTSSYLNKIVNSNF